MVGVRDREAWGVDVDAARISYAGALFRGSALVFLYLATRPIAATYEKTYGALRVVNACCEGARALNLFLSFPKIELEFSWQP